MNPHWLEHEARERIARYHEEADRERLLQLAPRTPNPVWHAVVRLMTGLWGRIRHSRQARAFKQTTVLDTDS